MIRAILLFTAMGAAVAGQFPSLSTTYDGSRLYFASPLTQPGTGQPNYGKLFVAEGGTIRPLVVWERYETTGFAEFGCTSSYDVGRVAVASDGSHLSFTARRDCRRTPRGEETGVPQSFVYDRDGRAVVSARGDILLSPNGRWGISASTAWDSYWTRYEFVDVESKVSQFALPVLGRNSPDQIDIANDGTYVLSDPQLRTFHPSGRSRVIDEQRASAAAISADGSIIVWLDAAGQFQRVRTEGAGLVRHNLGSPKGELVQPLRFAMSDDGKRVLYLARSSAETPAQAFLLDTDNATHRPIPSPDEGIEVVTLSGDGKVAWFASAAGRLVRVDVESGAVSSLTGPLNGLRLGGYLVAAGQPLTMSAYLRKGEKAPVKIGGRTAPVLSAAEGQVTIQVPWDLVADVIPTCMTAEIEDASSTEWNPVRTSVCVYDHWPSAVRSADGQSDVIAHETFDSLVTRDRPAKPGEIVHIYATGLGAVNAPMITGQPAGVSPLPTLADPFLCAAGGRLPVTYAGLAPGTIGYYQISVRLPDNARSGPLTVECYRPPPAVGIYPEPAYPSLRVDVWVR